MDEYSSLLKLSDPHTADEEISVEESNNLGGWIWVILFGIVIFFSFIFNAIMSFSILSHPKKRRNLIYILVLFVFFLNLFDYGLLIFEFTLGIQHVYPYDKHSCTFYQILLKSVPICQATLMPILLFSAVSLNNNKKHRLKRLAYILLGLLLMMSILSIPTSYFASIVVVKNKSYCEIDLGTTIVTGNSQISTSIYYLFYLAIFSFWLPLIISLGPLIKLYFKGNCDKYPEISVVLATVSSFFVFYLLHGIIVLIRHCLDVSGVQLTMHQAWIIKVAQSLSWLIAYFWHFTRPCLIFMLDSDLKYQLYRWLHISDYGSIAHAAAHPEQNTTTLAESAASIQRKQPIIMTISDELRPINNDESTA